MTPLKSETLDLNPAFIFNLTYPSFDSSSVKPGKGPDAGKDWGREEKGSKENEMVGWHHRLNGHEFEQTPGAVKNREAWHAAVHVVTKIQTQLSELNNM